MVMCVGVDKSKRRIDWWRTNCMLRCALCCAVGKNDDVIFNFSEACEMAGRRW